MKKKELGRNSLVFQMLNRLELIANPTFARTPPLRKKVCVNWEDSKGKIAQIWDEEKPLGLGYFEGSDLKVSFRLENSRYSFSKGSLLYYVEVKPSLRYEPLAELIRLLLK